MCRATAYESTICRHRWLTITTRCSPNAGFTNTPIHQFRFDSTSLLGGPRYQKASAGSCPNCDLKGQYDGNTIRMVLGNRSIGTHSVPPMTRRTGMQPFDGAVAIPQGMYTYPALGTANANGQILTIYQQQFTANKQAAKIASMRYHPEGSYSRGPRESLLCNVM